MRTCCRYSEEGELYVSQYLCPSASALNVICVYVRLPTRPIRIGAQMPRMCLRDLAVSTPKIQSSKDYILYLPLNPNALHVYVSHISFQNHLQQHLMSF